MKSWIFSGLLLLLFSQIPLHAQVVTPSLDPGRPVLLPSASSWRPASLVGVGSYHGTYQKQEAATAIKWDGAIDRQQGLLSLQSGLFTLEAAGSKTKVTETTDAGDETTDDSDANQFVLGMRFGEHFSIGVSSGSSGGEQRTTVKGAAASLRLSDSFFVAYGAESTEFDGMNWSERYVGLSLYSVGNLHVEYAQIYSPEVESGEKIKPESETDLSVVEILFSDFLLSAQRTRKLIGGSSTPTQWTADSFGLAYAPEEGISASLRYIVEDVFQEYQVYAWQAGLTYAF